MTDSFNLFESGEKTAGFVHGSEKDSQKSSANQPTKASHAYRTISEVSAELNVAAHVLRFWETKFSNIKPVKRAGNRRYYRPQDVEILRQIQHLLHKQKYTIKGAQAFFKQKNAQVNSEAMPALGEARGEGGLSPEKLKKIVQELQEIKALLA